MKLAESWLGRLALLAHLTGVLMLLLSGAMLPSAMLATADSSPDMAGQWTAIVGASSAGRSRGATPITGATCIRCFFLLRMVMLTSS